MTPESLVQRVGIGLGAVLEIDAAAEEEGANFLDERRGLPRFPLRASRSTLRA
jgi:hypothetical protein